MDDKDERAEEGGLGEVKIKGDDDKEEEDERDGPGGTSSKFIGCCELNPLSTGTSWSLCIQSDEKRGR